jgi:hypothetical protein
MKTEYQSTITIIEEILAVREDREASTTIMNRLIAYMLEVFPKTQHHSDPEDDRMRVREHDLTEEIIRTDSPYTDVLGVPADDFLPQLYPMLVVKLLLKDHRVQADFYKMENFQEFYRRYHRLIIFRPDRKRR